MLDPFSNPQQKLQYQTQQVTIGTERNTSSPPPPGKLNTDTRVGNTGTVEPKGFRALLDEARQGVITPASGALASKLQTASDIGPGASQPSRSPGTQQAPLQPTPQQPAAKTPTPGQPTPGQPAAKTPTPYRPIGPSAPEASGPKGFRVPKLPKHPF